MNTETIMTASLKLAADTKQLLNLQTFLEELSVKWKLDDKTLFAMNLALEELVTNTIFYGYNDQLPHFILIEFALHHDQMMRIVITDDGHSFNILNATPPDSIEKPIEEREIGGLGIHFVKTLMNQIAYERLNDRNILTLWYNTAEKK